VQAENIDQAVLKNNSSYNLIYGYEKILSSYKTNLQTSRATQEPREDHATTIA